MIMLFVLNKAYHKETQITITHMFPNDTPCFDCYQVMRYLEVEFQMLRTENIKVINVHVLVTLRWPIKTNS